MSEFTAQARGALKQVTTLLKGQTGIYATLAKEHEEVTSLIEQAISTKSSEERQRLLEKIRVELLSHTRAEEKTLYDALSEFEETETQTDESMSDHEQIEEMLREALSAPDMKSQTEAIEVLREAIEYHIQEEENDLFLRAVEVLPTDHESHLDKQFKLLKQEERRRLESDGLGWNQMPMDPII